MKVRLLNLAALSAMAWSAQAAAQQGDNSLERALADLNHGLVTTPQGGGVTTSASMGLDISGDFRVRNTHTNPAGAESDVQNTDARIRLNFAFDVNENASAFLQLVGAEVWGNPVAPGVPLRPGFFNGSYVAGGDTITQAGVTVTDLFGDAGEIQIGRWNYTFQSGRILGTDDWDNFPQSFSGLWYDNAFEEVGFNAFLISDFAVGGYNDTFTGTPLMPLFTLAPYGGMPPGIFTADANLWGGSLDFAFDDVPLVEHVHLSPYTLRHSDTGAGKYLWWYGAMLSGDVEMVDFDLEAVWRRDNLNRTSGTQNAWAADVTVDLGDALEEWNVDSDLELGGASADPGMVLSPTYHDTAGLADLLGFGGVWGGLADTWTVGIGVTPVQDWTGHVTYVDFDDSTGTGAFDASEIDVALSHVFPANVTLWAGLGRIDFSGNSPNAYVGYVTFGLPF